MLEKSQFAKLYLCQTFPLYDMLFMYVMYTGFCWKLALYWVDSMFKYYNYNYNYNYNIDHWTTLNDTSSNSNSFCDLLFWLNFTQLIEQPTTFMHGSILDLVITNSEELIYNVTVHSLTYQPMPSDHHIISLQLTLSANFYLPFSPILTILKLTIMVSIVFIKHWLFCLWTILWFEINLVLYYKHTVSWMVWTCTILKSECNLANHWSSSFLIS